MNKDAVTPAPGKTPDTLAMSGRALTIDRLWTGLAESALVALVAWGLHALLRSLGASFGMGALATVLTLALCTWLLHRRDERWRNLGMGRPLPWGPTLLWALGLLFAEMLLLPLLATPLADALGFGPQHLEAFADLQGNLGLYLLLLIPVGWGSAAFGEELIYRGFIFGRLSQALGGSRLAQVCALLLQAGLFAMGHRYLGPRGMLNAGLIGLLSGGAYIANGRKLWPLVIAHGAVDTVGLTSLYLGVAHG